MGSQTIVTELLHRCNEAVFLPKGVRIDLLKSCPEVIPVLAEWIYHDWWAFDATLTQEKLIVGMERRLNDDRIPLALVAWRGGKPIGTVALKEKGESEFGHLSEQGPWLGSLHVILQERQAGLGGELLATVRELANVLGYEAIFVYTSKFDNVLWYQKRGASILQTAPFRGHPVTIMQMSSNLRS